MIDQILRSPLKLCRIATRHPFFAVLLLSTTLNALAPCSAQARDMHARFGIGYNGAFANTDKANGVPGVSFKYGFTPDLAIAAIIGISTAEPSNSVTAVKLFKNVFFENNLNFYFTLGGGVVNAEDNSGAEFITALGAEFFIPGIESLGLSFETGVSFTNLSGSFVLNTLGASILNAGVHFYF